MQPGYLIILSGPSAGGKTTVAKMLLFARSDFSRVITTTTRPIRLGEQTAKDYYFVTPDEFEAMIARDELLEYIKYSGNFYGTTKAEIERVEKGENLVWVIDPTFASCAKDHLPINVRQSTWVFFIKAPNEQTIISRLAKRGMDQDEIKTRLEKDRKNWHELGSKFENIIINEDGKLQEAVLKILDHVPLSDNLPRK